jgi:hypothetical protein
MAYCGPRGIPLSEFLNWHPDDQQAALAWQSDEAQRCPHCGTAEWEWEADRDAYTPEVRVCRGCHRRQAEEKNTRDLAQQMGGVYVRLVPREAVADGDSQR